MKRGETERNDKARYFAGIDGGGSKTTVAIASQGGEIVSLVNTGPSRLASVGRDRAREEVESGLSRALREAGIDKYHLEAVGWGVGGLDTEKDRSVASEVLAETVPESCTLRIEDDAIIGLYSVTFGEPGVAIIAGTGSLLEGINTSGKRARVDGWGYLFGDLGSGYYIGRRSVMAVLEAYDGRGEETQLTELLLDELSLESPAELIDHFYPPREVPQSVAKLATLTDKAAVEGDGVAEEILQGAAKELFRSAITLIEKLSLRKMDRLPIGLIGGVFNSDLVRRNLSELLESYSSGLEVIHPNWPPAVGAIAAGMEAKNIALDQSVRQNLKQKTDTG